jgi:hypothetical protein
MAVDSFVIFDGFMLPQPMPLMTELASPMEISTPLLFDRLVAVSREDLLSGKRLERLNSASRIDIPEAS